MYNENTVNRYDIFIVLLTTCLCFGNVGGALQVDRILAILLAPAMLSGFSKAHNLYLNKLLKGLFLIYLYILISIFWTSDSGEGLKELVYYPVHFTLMVEIIVFSRKAMNPLNSLSLGWFNMALLCSLVAIWEITTGNHLNVAREEASSFNTGVTIVQHLTASVTFNNYNSYVTILCYSFPWIFYNLIGLEKRLLIKVLSFPVLIISTVIIIINASRGGVLAIILMVITYVLISKKAKITSIIIISLIAVVAYVILQYRDTLFAVLTARASEGGMFTDDARSVIWSNALKTFSTSMGFGIGVGGLDASMAQFSKGGINVTHNMFLEVLVQYGVIVFLAVLIFLLRLFKRAFRVEGHRKEVLLMSFVSMPAYFIIDSTYLLTCHYYVLIATLIVFANYELIRYNNRVLWSSPQL